MDLRESSSFTEQMKTLEPREGEVLLGATQMSMDRAWPVRWVPKSPTVCHPQGSPAELSHLPLPTVTFSVFGPQVKFWVKVINVRQLFLNYRQTPNHSIIFTHY